MAASVGGVLLSMYIVQVTANDGDVLDLDNQKNKQTTIVYDKNSDEYATLTQGREPYLARAFRHAGKPPARGHRYRG